MARSAPTLADSADRHALYQQAVNAPASCIAFLRDIYHQVRGRPPRVLREDFCGTALLATMWAEHSPEHRAVGVDLDPEALAWARAHNLAASPARERVELILADVLEDIPQRADIVCALNFSYYLLTTRRRLVTYFKRVRRALMPGGLFVLDSLGGTDAMADFCEERDCGEFTYVWRQTGFNPLDHGSTCTIGFTFPDGSALDPAFSYPWRMWTMPEIRDCLVEAGFSRVRIFWEYVDADDNPEYVEVVREENQEIFLTYLVAAP
ncbi:MAG: class I SAM-dependent methyltransferase [Myxococcales bacterium]|nr:class I SAM-dependent methyltransferase [Myxococcales bacterium]